MVNPVTLAHRRDLSNLLLNDTCVVSSVASTFDPNTGQSAAVKTTLHSGKCRVRHQRGSDLETAGTDLPVLMFRVTVPYDWDGISQGDVVDVTSTDGDLNGATLVVESVSASTYAGQRHLVCRWDR